MTECITCNGTGLVPGTRKSFDENRMPIDIPTKYRKTCPVCRGIRAE